MSVIIRLQNLPWSANAADIRAYFSGLSIPEGGVHIVGGEQGDAFIAFSTDEDARQAMLRDGGKLKEVKIKLFLSSRTEMLRIIEQARQQTLNLQNIMHQGNVAPPPVQPVVPSVPSSVYDSGDTKDSMKDDEEEKIRDDDEISHRERRDRRERDRSVSRDRGERGRSKDRSRDRDRDRGRHRDRDRDRRRRERSKSRDRYSRRRSRSRDRRRSRDKDIGRSRRRDSEPENEEKNVKEMLQVQQQMHHQQTTVVQSQVWESMQGKPPPPLLPDPILPQMILQHIQQHQRKEDTPPIQPPQQPMMGYQDQDRRPFGTPQYQTMPRGREQWSNQQMDPRLRHPIPPQNFPSMQYSLMTPPQYHTGNPMKDPNELIVKAWNNSSGTEEQDVCIEIHGLPLNATYVDVKRLFDGLSIPPDGIKMINDNHGNRTGIAYVKFTNPNHKRLALNQNGKKVRSSIVEVLHLRESIYKTAVDNYKPEKDVSLKSEDMEIDNGDSVEEIPWKRDGDMKKINFQDPRIASKNAAMNKNQGKSESPRKEKLKHECVLVKGLPMHSTERDILDFFSELGIAPVQIHFVYDNMGQLVGDAFCQFENSDEADKAATKNKALLGRSNISVFIVPREEMERSKNYMQDPYGPPHYRPPFMPMRGQQPYPMRMPNDGMMGGGGDRMYMEGGAGGGGGSGGGGDRSRYNNDRYMGDNMGGDRMPMMGGRGRGRGGMMQGRPPRRTNNNRTNRASSPYIDGDSLEKFGQPGCVVAMENIHFKADVDEIMEFFDGFGVEHENVIRRFDDNGRATGDARVALKNPTEASRAVRQLMFKTIRGRPIKLSIVQ